jgi:hypothetical protein
MCKAQSLLKNFEGEIRMKEVLGLLGTDYGFEKTNSGNRKETNNTLVFHPIDSECDTTSICNDIFDDRYFPLIDFLNTEKNLVVYWSQIEGTTSDYTIYKDMHLSPEELRSFRKIMKRLEESIKGKEEAHPYKYMVVENGVLSKLSF